MPIKKFKKPLAANNTMSGLGLVGFPIVSETPQESKSAVRPQTAANVQSVKVQPTKIKSSVPKIPRSFYENTKANDDDLSREIDILNDDSHYDELTLFLRSLKKQIFADKTWLALSSGSASYAVKSSDFDISENFDSQNEIVTHALSVNHLIFVKNKTYIDRLFDNRLGLTSLFIVPLKKDDTQAMILAGYKSPKGELRSIVTALNDCRESALHFL